MATFNKFNQFVEDLAEGVHNLGSDTLQIYLSNATPNAAADSVKADLAEIATGNGYTGPITVTITSSAQSGGTYSLVGTDLIPAVTATGSVGPFRYVVLFNTTATGDPLIGWWDFGSALTLANTDTFDVDFGPSILTLA